MPAAKPTSYLGDYQSAGVLRDPFLKVGASSNQNEMALSGTSHPWAQWTQLSTLRSASVNPAHIFSATGCRYHFIKRKDTYLISVQFNLVYGTQRYAGPGHVVALCPLKNGPWTHTIPSCL